MRIDRFMFGSIRIDGEIYAHDVVIDRGQVRKRKKKRSKPFRDDFGHTPLSVEEDIPWNCRRLVVGTGAEGALPVMDQVKRAAERRKVELLTLPTPEAIRALQDESKHERDPPRDLLMRRLIQSWQESNVVIDEYGFERLDLAVDGLTHEFDVR